MRSGWPPAIEVLAREGADRPEDPTNANEALILLGIAEPDTGYPDDEYERLLLRPWAVQAALSRPAADAFQ